VQLFLHSGITIGTLTAIVANLTLNGSAPFKFSHHAPSPDPVPPSAAARNVAVRTVRMWLLLRKVQKERQEKA
jgi:NCS2 family nucleobase:cation symporter-2